MRAKTHLPALTALALATTLAVGAAPQASAMTSPAMQQGEADQQCQRRSARQQEPEERFPNATREAPTERASARMGSRLGRINTAHERDQFDQVRELADALLVEERANNYDKAYAANIAANAAYSLDDTEAAKAYLGQVLELDALDNNGHYQAMLMLAQLQAQDDEFDASLVTLERYLSETRSDDAGDHALQGQLLYQAERYEEAIPALQRAIEGSEEPQTGWTQALLAAYVETDRTAEATALAEQIAGESPGDKNSQMNLVTMYMQAGQDERAIEVLERLRAAGELTEDREYRNLMALHLNRDDGEAQAIAVINEGLERGVLEENHQTYVALAQAYYFSDQIEPAVEAYRKAAPLADNGETYLNLARVLYGEGREQEAAEAARQALEKGVNNDQDARRIIGN